MPSSAPDGSQAFGGFAALYARCRPLYPQSVFDALEAALRGGRRAHAVDLGAGTGQATRALADRFVNVTAVEPDPRMAENFPKFRNVALLNEAAENVDFVPGSIDAVIAATSFHWMEQSEVCMKAHRWLRPGGVFFPFRYGAFDMIGVAKPVFDRHAALWAPFKDKRLTANIEYVKPIVAAGLFATVTPFVDELGATLAPADAAGLLGTTSYGSAFASANYQDPEDYIKELADDLRACGEETELQAPLRGAIAVKALD